MSEYSAAPINDEELIARFVFSPLHVRKTGEIKPNIYDHIIDKGCSIQRENLVSHQEIVSFISAFLEKINKNKTKEKDKVKWHSVLSAKCSELRSIHISNRRGLCIYDTANKENPAHGEICSNNLPLEDIMELQYDLGQAFKQIHPAEYRQGHPTSALPGTNYISQ